MLTLSNGKPLRISTFLPFVVFFVVLEALSSVALTQSVSLYSPFYSAAFSTPFANRFPAARQMRYVPVSVEEQQPLHNTFGAAMPPIHRPSRNPVRLPWRTRRPQAPQAKNDDGAQVLRVAEAPPAVAAALDAALMEKREGHARQHAGYGWEQCEFSPLSCLIRRRRK